MTRPVTRSAAASTGTPKPLMPNEVIRVELKTPKSPKMNTNQYQFTHANGSVKPKVVPKLVVAPATS